MAYFNVGRNAAHGLVRTDFSFRTYRSNRLVSAHDSGCRRKCPCRLGSLAGSDPPSQAAQNAIYYRMWDGKAWSDPIDILFLPTQAVASTSETSRQLPTAIWSFRRAKTAAFG